MGRNKTIGAKVDEEVQKKLKIKAALEDTTVSEMIRNWAEKEAAECDIEIPTQ